MKINPLQYFVPLSYQKPVLVDERKNILVAGGNRSGKTVIGAVATIQYALENPESDIWCSSWYDLSIPVQQREINRWLPKNEVHYGKFNDVRGFTNRLVVFKNGSMIKFKTYEQGWETFQGASKDWIWLDEEAPQTILNECKARLMDRNGAMLRTMTPLNGLTYTYDEFFIKPSKESATYFFDTSHNTHIDTDAFNRIINEFADKEGEVRQTGKFLNLRSGQAYYAWSEDNIIEIDQFKYMHNRPLELSWDFNVDLMTVGIHQEHNGCDFLFDYVELKGEANTERLCQMIKDKFPKHKAGWIHYGDISGNQRSPAASRTNWKIIEDNFIGSSIYYQKIRNINDRVSDTNARLRNRTGEIKYFVTRNCSRHISDFRKTTWELLMQKGKAGDTTHASDGVSYMLHWKYPLRGTIGVSQR